MKPPYPVRLGIEPQGSGIKVVQSRLISYIFHKPREQHPSGIRTQGIAFPEANRHNISGADVDFGQNWRHIASSPAGNANLPLPKKSLERIFYIFYWWTEPEARYPIHRLYLFKIGQGKRE